MCSIWLWRRPKCFYLQNFSSPFWRDFYFSYQCNGHSRLPQGNHLDSRLTVIAFFSFFCVRSRQQRFFFFFFLPQAAKWLLHPLQPKNKKNIFKKVKEEQFSLTEKSTTGTWVLVVAPCTSLRGNIFIRLCYYLLRLLLTEKNWTTGMTIPGMNRIKTVGSVQYFTLKYEKRKALHRMVETLTPEVCFPFIIFLASVCSTTRAG